MCDDRKKLDELISKDKDRLYEYVSGIPYDDDTLFRLEKQAKMNEQSGVNDELVLAFITTMQELENATEDLRFYADKETYKARKALVEDGKDPSDILPGYMFVHAEIEHKVGRLEGLRAACHHMASRYNQCYTPIELW